MVWNSLPDSLHEPALVFWFFLSPTAEAPTLTFTQNTSKDAIPRKDVPFEGFENKI